MFPAEGPDGGQRFTMTQPGEVLLLDDTRVIHETTPIQPLDDGGRGRRDTLVIPIAPADSRGRRLTE